MLLARTAGRSRVGEPDFRGAAHGTLAVPAWHRYNGPSARAPPPRDRRERPVLSPDIRRFWRLSAASLRRGAAGPDHPRPATGTTTGAGPVSRAAAARRLRH